MAKAKSISNTSGEHHGWTIYCPGCDDHHVLDERWTFNGDVDAPTFNPSLLYRGLRVSPRCHSRIRDGKIEFLKDSSHKLAGQTVELPELED